MSTHNSIVPATELPFRQDPSLSGDIKLDIINTTKVKISSCSRQDPLDELDTQPRTDSVAINIDQLQLETCEICMADCSAEELKTPLDCHHAFCSDCLVQYLDVKINSNEVLNIPCPQDGCEQIFSDKAVEGVVGAEQHKRYQDLVLKKVSMKDPKQKYCPQPGCSRDLKIDLEEEFSTCDCGAKVCNACNNLYHEGKTCIEAMDVEFEMYAKENQVRFCMMCKTVIVKEEGCNTIKCAVCDYKWCWLCGNEYDPKHDCNGEWSPMPPASVRLADFKGRMVKTWKEASVIKKVGIGLSLILLSPLILVTFLILAPTLYMMKNRANSLLHEERKSLMKSVFSVLGVILFGLAYLPQTLSLLLCLTVYGVIIRPIMIMGKALKRRLGSEVEKEEEDKTRWQSRDSHKFVYRPTDPHS